MCNFVPVQRENYCIGVPIRGTWAEVFTSDAKEFGGGGVTNGSAIKTQERAHARLRAKRLADLAGLLGVLPGVREKDPQAGPARARQKDGIQNRGQGEIRRGSQAQGREKACPGRQEKDRGESPLTLG